MDKEMPSLSESEESGPPRGQDDQEDKEVLTHLQELRKRANMLSEGMKQLSMEVPDESSTESGAEDITMDDIDEIVKRYAAKGDDMDTNGNGYSHINEVPVVEQQDPNQVSSSQKEVIAAVDEALESIKNFVPTRQPRQLPMHLDLSHQDEHHLRVTNRGMPYYWHMPFRLGLYKETVAGNRFSTTDGSINDQRDKVEESKSARPRQQQECSHNAGAIMDPFMFAPTGDIYSYFQRRSLASFAPHNRPLRYETLKNLGGGRFC